MKGMQRMGAIAALIEAGTFLVGFALLVSVLAPLGNGELETEETVAFMADHEALLYTWNLVIYVAFGVFLIVLTLALHARLKLSAPALSQIAAALGLIWAGLVIAGGMIANVGAATVIDLYDSNPTQAGTVWLAVNTVSIGVGGGNEIIGGLWVMLISWIAMKAGNLPRELNYLGLLAGAAGVITIVPPLADASAIFGLGLIGWFIWLGLHMLRDESSLA